jgi:hypothetical protein
MIVAAASAILVLSEGSFSEDLVEEFWRPFVGFWEVDSACSKVSYTFLWLAVIGNNVEESTVTLQSRG